MLLTLLFLTGYGFADNREELLHWVDSAYAEAMSGNLQEAICINEEGLARVPADSTELKCEFYSCLLYCYHRLGDYEKALHYGELCLSYDETQDDQANISASLGNLAGIYSSAGKHDVAIDYLNRAIRIEEELLQTESDYSAKSLAIRKAMMGEVLLAKAKQNPDHDNDSILTQALRLTREALDIDTELDRQPQIGMRLSQLGNIYLQIGDTAQANNCNQKALKIAQETGNRASEVITLLQLGQYREAADIAHSIGMKRQEMEACDKLAIQEKEAGRFSEAVTLMERSALLRQALINEESERQLTLWQTRYNTQQKEQQLLLQEQTIAAQKTRTRLLITLIIIAITALVAILLYARLQVQRKKEIEELGRIKDRNYAIITHDLKSPMLAQQQILRLVYNDFDNISKEELYTNTGRLLASSNEQLNMLYNLQEIALLETGKQKVEPIRTDLGSLISDTIASIKSYADLKHIEIATDLHRSLVMADRETMKIVIRNLLCNAVKFSYEGSKIEVGICDESGFYVRDHGIGISEERKNEILNANHIVTSRAGTNNENGIGLGLLICRELISLNNGTLHIESATQKGSTFTVTLPKIE